MKKFVLLLSIIAFVFTSCEGPTGPMGPPGEEILPYNEVFTIRSQDWKHESTGRYASLYSCLVDIEIGDNAYEEGFVNVYFYQNNNGFEVQTPLPYWIQNTDGPNTWLEGYNFDFDAGTVVFYADWKNGERPPTCKFRVAVAP